MWCLTSTAKFTVPGHGRPLLACRVQAVDARALTEERRMPLHHAMPSRRASAASVTSSTGRVSTMPTLK